MLTVFQSLYLKSEFIEAQFIELHNWKDVEYYKRVGYVVTEQKEEESSFKMEKPVEVRVYVEYEHMCLVFRPIKQILEFYDKSVMTAELFVKFRNDAESGRLSFSLDVENNKLIFESAPNV